VRPKRVPMMTATETAITVREILVNLRRVRGLMVRLRRLGMMPPIPEIALT
jgi:hypothetical protein